MEEWKDIKGYEGYYQVSNFGSIRSVRRVIMRTHRKQTIKERILKIQTNDWGYKVIRLTKNGIGKGFCIHKLVAAAFLENPEGKNEVNHIDGNKQNNLVNNLEWCTHQENIQHAFDTGLHAPTCHWGAKNKISKKVIDESTGVIYNCVREAAEVLGLKYSTLRARLAGQSINTTTFKYM